MWLVRIDGFELEEFTEGSIPPYAIVSHRWTSEELNFKEVAKKRIDANKRGYAKLLGACTAAAQYHVDYIWIDTCCIDKRSSAELSEAINSMFAWYEQAEVCLAYLEDVESGSGFGESFKESEWFTRAWTLQELIAPQHVHFFGSDWIRVGAKDSLADVIEQITAVPIYVLERRDRHPLSGYSIAERMSWAANRLATRTEDVAYSLLGLFGVNMPLLYGEGSRAFTRLQQELVRNTNDMTFMLWGVLDSTVSGGTQLLANSPKDFKDSGGKIINTPRLPAHLSITNIGLEVDATFVKYGFEHYGLVLNTGLGQRLENFVLLVRKDHSFGKNYRVGIAKIGRVSDDRWLRNYRMLIEWARDGWSSNQDAPDRDPSFEVGTCESYPINSVRLESRLSQTRHNYTDLLVHDRYYFDIDFTNPQQPAAVELLCGAGTESGLRIDLAFDFEGRACALIGNYHGRTQIWEISDHTEQSNRPTGRANEYMMIDVPVTGVADSAAFLRTPTNYYRHEARVPARLTGVHRPIWVAFTQVPRQGNKFIWKFEILENDKASAK
jgi:hypothetical protein